ncbi:polysaccharide lyase 6 family protein [Microbulbifer sp. 2201CG32-9]|uniref:polysaccharide lyase 6 family protein n=1 Tax=unclassified Microbulbifer TaxID=2619833 RepID=UPI00345BE43A
MRFKIVSLILLFSLSTVGLAKDYYVSDSLTLQNSITSLACGDNVILQNGNYINTKLSLEMNCSASLPIVIKAENPGMAFFSGDMAIAIPGKYYTLSGLSFIRNPGGITRTASKAHLITVTGRFNRITNTKFDDIDDVEGVWVLLNGKNNRVDHSYFANKSSVHSYINMDIDPAVISYHLVDHNYFSRPLLGSNGGSASRVGHGSMHNYRARIIFEYNLFENEDGESEIVSVKSSENIFRYNTFKNSRGHLSLRQGQRSLVYDNYFLGNSVAKERGIFIRGEDHVIFNNYFSDLRPTASETDYGSVCFGASSTTPDPARAAIGLNPYHYPLTKNVLFANNTLINGYYSNISIGCQWDLTDPKNRTTLPESLRFANNLIINNSRQVDASAVAVNQHSSAIDILWSNNYFDTANAGITDGGLMRTTLPLYNDATANILMPSVPTTASSTELSTWIDNIPLDTRWVENNNLISRIKNTTAVGFEIPIDPRSMQRVLPLSRTEVGTNF